MTKGDCILEIGKKSPQGMVLCEFCPAEDGGVGVGGGVIVVGGMFGREEGVGWEGVDCEQPSLYF